MSQDNSKLVRTLLETVAEGGFDAARDLLHPVVLDHDYGMLCTVRDSKIALIQWFHDKAQALEAARLSE